MGNVYRFIEPVLLLMLKQRGKSYGYDLSEHMQQYMLTDASVERAALYRSLRTLEAHGYVCSKWETDDSGPARRVYSLTKEGERHLQEWGQVMDRLGSAMKVFAGKALELKGISA